MEFGLDFTGADRLETIAMINDFLLRQMAEDRESVLILMRPRTSTMNLLEQVRLAVAIWRQMTANCSRSCSWASRNA